MSLESPHSSYKDVDLLAGLVINDDVYDKVRLKELTGTEEDILAEPNGSESKKMSRVLANCIVEFFSSNPDVKPIKDQNHKDVATRSLTVGDRLYLFIKLRVISLGEMYNMDFNYVTDDGNTESFVATLNLDDLEVVKLKDFKDRTRELVLNSGRKVVIKLATGMDEEKIEKLGNSNKSRISQMMLNRIDTIDGKPATTELLKTLTIKERNYIRSLMEEFDAGIETTVEAVAPNGQIVEKQLDLGQKDFFFPSGMSED